MPFERSNYKPPFLFKNGHFSTIYAGVFRTIKGVLQKRERIHLKDGDFLDLDWSTSNNPTKKVVLLVHGLEGDAQTHYMLGTAKIVNQAGFDCCAVNLRGCSGVPNLLYRSYHSGATEDIIEVIAHILQKDRYQNIYLIGFSLGGNLILKYLGEGNSISKEIKAAVGISVPCSLKSASDELLKFKNGLYSQRFKKNLIQKLRAKKEQFPELISEADIKSISTLKDFDDVYTSKTHGFNDALDYYNKCSSAQFLDTITIPTLIINAKNDSFLGTACYPKEQAMANSKLYLEIPDYGGHVGFWGKQNISYTENRIKEFLNLN